MASTFLAVRLIKLIRAGGDAVIGLRCVVYGVEKLRGPLSQTGSTVPSGGRSRFPAHVARVLRFEAFIESHPTGFMI